MTFFVVIAVLILIAVLAPRYGADSRRLTDRAGGPPDLLTDPPERQGSERQGPERPGGVSRSVTAPVPACAAAPVPRS